MITLLFLGFCVALGTTATTIDTLSHYCSAADLPSRCPPLALAAFGSRFTSCMPNMYRQIPAHHGFEMGRSAGDKSEAAVQPIEFTGEFTTLSSLLGANTCSNSFAYSVNHLAKLQPDGALERDHGLSGLTRCGHNRKSKTSNNPETRSARKWAFAHPIGVVAARDRPNTQRLDRVPEQTGSTVLAVRSANGEVLATIIVLVAR